jgi:hypothetical protein
VTTTQSDIAILPSNVDDVRFPTKADQAQRAPAKWTNSSALFAELTPHEPEGYDVGWFEMLVAVALRMVGEALAAIPQLR